MILRSIFAKIFQWCQCPFAKLYFIKYDQCLFFYDRLSCYVWQNRNQIIRADVFFKGFIQSWIHFKIKICYILIMFSSKFQNRICLSYLSCSLQDKWFSVFTFFPVFQEVHDFSVHYFNLLQIYIFPLIAIPEFTVRFVTYS